MSEFKKKKKKKNETKQNLPDVRFGARKNS